MTRRTVLALVAALVLMTGAAEAQVALRFYVTPKTGTGTPIDPRRPKYIGDMPVTWQAVDYGRDDTFLVGAQVTAAQHTELAANLDVIAIPQNLDATIGLSALTTVQSRLEGLNIPADWVTTSHTYRDVLRITARLFVFRQRLDSRGLGTFFEAGITLDTRINQLTQAQRDALALAAADLALDTSGISGPTTLRQALRLLANQIAPVAVAGQQF